MALKFLKLYSQLAPVKKLVLIDLGLFMLTFLLVWVEDMTSAYNPFDILTFTAGVFLRVCYCHF